MVDGIDFDKLFIEPRPDEDAWEAFLDLALERIGGHRGPGLTNKQIAELEEGIEAILPFEVGLMLVMGVPQHESWWQWDHDPKVQYEAWNERLLSGILFDVDENEFWFPSWGERPATAPGRHDVVRAHFDATIPPLFPIFGHRAVALSTATGHENSDGNPVFSVHQTDVVLYGEDLAAWMHREFDVPLPMWPSDDRRFDFWSELSQGEISDPDS